MTSRCTASYLSSPCLTPGAGPPASLLCPQPTGPPLPPGSIPQVWPLSEPPRDGIFRAGPPSASTGPEQPRSLLPALAAGVSYPGTREESEFLAPPHRHCLLVVMVTCMHFGDGYIPEAIFSCCSLGGSWSFLGCLCREPRVRCHPVRAGTGLENAKRHPSLRLCVLSMSFLLVTE